MRFTFWSDDLACRHSLYRSGQDCMNNLQWSAAQSSLWPVLSDQAVVVDHIFRCLFLHMSQMFIYKWCLQQHPACFHVTILITHHLRNIHIACDERRNISHARWIIFVSFLNTHNFNCKKSQKSINHIPIYEMPFNCIKLTLKICNLCSYCQCIPNVLILLAYKWPINRALTGCILLKCFFIFYVSV